MDHTKRVRVRLVSRAFAPPRHREGANRHSPPSETVSFGCVLIVRFVIEWVSDTYYHMPTTFGWLEF